MEEKKNPFTFLKNLLYKEVADENQSSQFHIMMRIYYLLMITYAIIINIILLCSGKINTLPYLLIWIPLFIAGLVTTYFFSGRIVFHYFAICLLGWMAGGVRLVGWGYGMQNFLYPLLVTSFFATYGNHLEKGLYTVFLCVCRLGMFLYTQNFPALIDVSGTVGTVIQTLNTITIFISMFEICVAFSNARQAAVHKLSMNNQKLKQETETDALTGLMNRRCMHAELEKCVNNKNGENFVIAMGDIDFFKKVNDTLGHNFGDQVLKAVSQYFLEYMEGKGIASRWGGEEFLFLFPNINGDEAFMYVQTMKSHLEKMPITYNDQTINITMTFGVEEFDFQSNVAGLVQKADEKLYMGKEAGRNRVIF